MAELLPSNQTAQPEYDTSKLWCRSDYHAEALAAFTLMELLVVISIIALLIAILTPGLEQARLSARMTQCQASLRELGVGTHIYMVDHDGYLPLPYYMNGEYNWFDQVVRGVMGFDLKYREKGKQKGSTTGFKSDFWCPEQSTYIPSNTIPGRAGYLWSPPSDRTYGMNDFGAANSLAPHLRKHAEFSYPAATYLYTDTSPSHPWGTHATHGLYWPLHFGGRAHEPTFYVDYRHQGQVNMAYVDGHVDIPRLIPDAGQYGNDALPWADAPNKKIPWGNLPSNPLGDDNFGGPDWIAPRGLVPDG